jgi:hypothetical protein
MTNAPDSLPDLRSDLGRALAFITAHRPDYENGRDYYLGTKLEVSASPFIRKLVADQANFAPISLAHIPVDVIAEKVELAGVQASDAAADKILTDILDANDLDDELDDWVHKAGYFGDYYVIVDPTELDGDRLAPDGIRTVGSSPLTTVVIYEADERTPDFGAKVWRDGKRWKALLYYNDVTVKLITAIGSGNSDPKAEDFDLDFDIEEDEARIPHEGDRLLVKHLAIGGRPYGVPLHRKAWGPQDAITKISATNLSNVDGLGFASRWALADPMAEIDDDIDDDFGTDGPATEPADSDGMTSATTGTSRVRSLPGALSLLRGIKQVGQFDETPSDEFLKPLDWYVRVMAVACGIALFEFDLAGEQPSGESRRRAEARANKKAAKVKRAVGAFVRDIADTALALLGTKSEVTVAFTPSETATDKEGIELVAAKIATGVPVRKALLEAGYTDEEVEEWFPKSTPHVTMDTLKVLAQALAQLGQAKTLGVITDAELADMLPTILTAARNEGPAVGAPAAPVTAIGTAAALAAAREA